MGKGPNRSLLVALALGCLLPAAASGKPRPHGSHAPAPPPPPPAPAAAPAAPAAPVAPVEDARVQAARETFTLGVELYEKGSIVRAEEQFRLATQFAPGKPKPYYYLGRALVDLGRCADAVAALDIYFRIATSDHENRDHASELRTRCENELARKGGTLLVESSPDGAEVTIDDENGVPAGVTPFGTDRLQAGPHLVFLRKPGFQKVSRAVTLLIGHTVRVILTLEPDPAAAKKAEPVAVAPPPPPVAAPPPVTPPPAVATVEPRPDSSPAPNPDGAKAKAKATRPEPTPAPPLTPRQGALRGVGVALLLVGVAGAAAGVTAGLLLPADARGSASVHWVAMDSNAPAGSPPPTPPPVLDTTALMVSTAVAGGVFVLTGAVLAGLSARRDAPAPPPKVTLVPALLPGGGGLALSGRF